MNNNQVMALAAMCQVALQVDKLAQYGQSQLSDVLPLLNSLIVTDPQNPQQVYGELHELRTGYRCIVEQFGNSKQKNLAVVKYVSGLMQLERILSKNPKALQQLGGAIDEIKHTVAQSEDEITDDAIISAFASTYATVISPLGHRIQVNGQPALLKQKTIQDKIRALLLAGIRAAVLWRQLGGKRRQLIFAKNKILATAQAAL